jgi:AraC family transcriptional regulator of adaptative response / DNA-3-methyladenine glycosylase II
MAAMSAAAESPAEIRDEDACYRALTAHDARFDGHFFTGVISTGVYCRPVCRVRVPRRENCRFFNFAAQAEQAGFRPCLRCRPELAPGPGTWTTQDASGVLARQGARMLDELAATANETAPWSTWPSASVSATATCGAFSKRILVSHPCNTCKPGAC